jgi:hypothetical protein
LRGRSKNVAKGQEQTHAPQQKGLLFDHFAGAVNDNQLDVDQFDNAWFNRR